MTMPIPSEDQECYWLVDYLNLLKLRGKVLNFTHVANETYTKHWSVKVRNKKKGVSAGFPDYIVVLQNTLAFIEMKRSKGGVVSPEQKAWLSHLSSLGHKAYVCKGFTEAKAVIDSLINDTQVYT